MYEICIARVFKAAHSLVLSGEAEPMHQHNWQVQVTVSAAELNSEGVVMDFLVLERLLEQAIEPLTGAENLNQLELFAENPSAECVAAYFYRQLQKELSKDVNLVRVMVEEAPGCRASYFE